ncbi:MAG: formate-dependent phosphoribosylglycinamide formyltransferase [Campylobacterales bacterium]|nr:formate-dependent phosphoribosylglycinamide formyltransferase [Campylobacterales bacterium]
MIFTTPLKDKSTKILLLGSGELGKEVAIEANRLGIEVVAVDRYADAPAALVANRSYVIDMLDAEQILEVVRREKPTYILPEIEAINIDALFTAEEEGFNVIPNAKAVSLTMNRKGIREFAAVELGLKTSGYEFVSTKEELEVAAKKIGFPCVIKPVMSSSGHGQSICKDENGIADSWEIAKEGRGDSSELIVEEFVKFDYEITLLTARTENETVFCEPIGHVQQDGDYIFSWQPMEMSDIAIAKSKEIAKTVTDGLSGRGIFGVELFVKGDEVYFSEVSPRPHDTGMVTMITQNQSEFALHVRAVLGFPLNYQFTSPGASAAYKSTKHAENPKLEVPASAFDENVMFRMFGKPESHHGRRLAVVLVSDEDAMRAKEQSENIVNQIKDV